jgi:hypothetical protein
MQHYPAQLQPPPVTGDRLWGNAQVKKGDPKMTEGLRGQEPKTLGQYIEASQNYQADVMAEQATGPFPKDRRLLRVSLMGCPPCGQMHRASI